MGLGNLTSYHAGRVIESFERSSSPGNIGETGIGPEVTVRIVLFTMKLSGSRALMVQDLGKEVAERAASHFRPPCLVYPKPVGDH